MVGIMKAEIAVLIILIMALIFPALSSVCQNEACQNGLPEDKTSRLSIMSADTKRLEERINGALNDMLSQSGSAGVGKAGYSGSIPFSSKRSNPYDPGLSGISQSNDNTSINSSAANLSANNSSTSSPSINLSAADISAINSSAANISINSSKANGPATTAFAETPPALKPSTPGQGNSTGQQKIGSSSNSKFLGHYAISSSQHQMGKNDIDSSTFLSGSFSMEKAVKFQDRGI